MQKRQLAVISREARKLLNPKIAAKCYKRQTSSKNRIA